MSPPSARSLRVLHVVPTYLPAVRYGGPIYSVHGLCKGLAERGHHVEVATTNVDGASESDVPLDGPVALDGVQINYFTSRRLRRIYYSPSMYRFLSNRISDFDVVHTHSVFLWPTGVASRIAWHANVPHVLSPRGMLVRELLSNKSRIAKSAWLMLTGRRQIRRAAAIHVTSPVEAADVRSLHLPVRTVFDIPNGVDVDPVGALGPSEQSQAAEWALPSNYVLYLGRLSWKKGIERLVEALVHSPRAYLAIAGNDEEGISQQLRLLAQQSGVADRVAFLGPVYGEAKQRLLSHAAVVVLPSRSENYGNVVLEAMACGVAVMVTSAVGISGTVKEWNCGTVVEPEAAAMGRELDRLLASPHVTSAMGRRGAECARTLAWPHIAKRMEDAYRLVLEGRSHA